MKRAGWNPTRRNRNLGTAKSGHGLANRLVIPASWRDWRLYWNKLHEPIRVDIHGLTILVEPCRQGFVHAVTVDDIVRMLGLLPKNDVTMVRTVVLRQPTKKQRILEPVWGRLAYFFDFGGHQGPAILLEACPPEQSIERVRSLSPDEAEEIERLRADGHTVSGNRRWTIQTSLAATRSTQLFRTLPHEVGHYVHYDREVLQPAGDDIDTQIALGEAYFTKPAREREDFAHRYAREIVERLSAEGSIPFPRLVDEAAMNRWGLDPTWFGGPCLA
jgi:ribosomal protein S13